MHAAPQGSGYGVGDTRDAQDTGGHTLGMRDPPGDMDVSVTRVALQGGARGQ